MRARRLSDRGPEAAAALAEADENYQEGLKRFAGRKHYDCGALAGLMRIQYARGDAAGAEAYAGQAEGLAGRYEYNEYLAAIALTRGHMAFDRGDVDAAGAFYREALVHGLRFNRFVLDELLGAAGAPTPLHPLIPFCRARGEQGQALLRELAGWWQTAANRLMDEPATTISPVGSGNTLLDAEALARRLEPGDGAPQRTVVEQLVRG
jgi:tetratricopeptide (TPR) repeat protein